MRRAFASVQLPDVLLLVKMWTPQRKVQFVLLLAELKSVTRVQRRARREWNVDPPTCRSIYEWDKTLRETGSLISQAGKHPKQHVTEETLDRVRESFSRSPRTELVGCLNSRNHQEQRFILGTSNKNVC